MRQMRIQPILFAYLALLLTASLLVACDEEQVVPPPDKIITASGMVLDMLGQAPLVGARVQLITNEFFFDDPDYERTCACEGDLCNVWTISDGDGVWRMPVPVKYNENLAPLNMLMKVSLGTDPPMYNMFQPGTVVDGENKGDLLFLDSFSFALFALTSGSSLSDLIAGQLAVFPGVSIGFADMDYPATTVSIPGVTVTAEGGDPPDEIPITYLLGDGATSKLGMGVFYFSVPDANDDAAPSIQIKATKPGSVFVGGYYPACPGSSTGVAVIDPYYQP